MTTNFRGEGKTLLVTAGGTVVGGTPAAFVGVLGVYGANALTGQKVAVHIEGVHILPCDAADAFTQGMLVVFDVSTGTIQPSGFVTAAGDLVACGVAMEAKAGGAGTLVPVRLTPGTATIA